MTIHRRDFLKQSVVAGASVELGDWTGILGLLGVRDSQQNLTEQEQVVQLLAGGDRHLVIAKTIISSHAASTRLKEASCYLIGEFGSSDQVSVLFQALEHSADQVRHAAIEAIQKLLNPFNKAVPLLVRDREDLLPAASLPSDSARWIAKVRLLLKDESDLVRAAAAQTLGLLRAKSCLAELRELATNDPMEPVRYFASRAIEILTGELVDFIGVDMALQSRVPVVTVGRAGNEQAVQLGPLFRVPWSNPQAKFTIPEWIPARRQTIARLWWNDEHLFVNASCDDPGAGNSEGDQLTLLLQPGKEPQIHRFECPAEGNRLVWVLIREGRRHVVHSVPGLSFSTKRDNRGWYASLRIPFRILSNGSPLDQTWRANLIRIETHGGGRPEVSSWAYHHRDAQTTLSLGILKFSKSSSQIELQPEPENVFSFPIDDYSQDIERDRPVEPEQVTVWGSLIPPEQLTKGTNTFLASVNDLGRGRKLTVSAIERASVVASTSKAFEQGAAGGKVNLSLEVPGKLSAGALDLEVELQDDKGSVQHRTFFPSIPIVTPPKDVVTYPLQVVEGHEEWSPGRIRRDSFSIRDHGPMLLTESYPMVLVNGVDGMLYGGTYPGGRLFSYDPEAGRVEDLGSPSPPHNHLHDLVASPDGLIFGGLYRPEGRLFVFDSKTRKTTDMGVPVPGGSSGTCKVQTWAKGRVYGCQRGHLFFAESRTNQVVNKGAFVLNNKRYPVSVIIADTAGNLLGVAGGKLFRYLSETDQILLSDVSFIAEGNTDVLGGWLLRGPGGRVYALANDGRLLRWEPEHDRLMLVARYANVPPGPGVSVAVTETQELVVGRSGIVNEKENMLLVYRPGRAKPLNLGNPIPGHLYLTALTLGKDNVVYGVSTRRAYSLMRTPIHIYSLRISN